jgi:ABC-type dipeptide/oligopeptide/nickel transport system permease subunit
MPRYIRLVVFWIVFFPTILLMVAGACASMVGDKLVDVTDGFLSYLYDTE